MPSPALRLLRPLVNLDQRFNIAWKLQLPPFCPPQTSVTPALWSLSRDGLPAVSRERESLSVARQPSNKASMVEKKNQNVKTESRFYSFIIEKWNVEVSEVQSLTVSKKIFGREIYSFFKISSFNGTKVNGRCVFSYHSSFVQTVSSRRRLLYHGMNI